MFISTPKKRFIFVFFFILIFSIINVFLFFSIYLSNNINIFFAVHPFNICYKYPNGWKLIKNSYIIISFFYYLILANVLYSNLFRKNPKSSSQKNVFTLDPYFNLKIGLDGSNNNVFLPLKGLFQNILITGTIGSGKTSSASGSGRRSCPGGSSSCRPRSRCTGCQAPSAAWPAAYFAPAAHRNRLQAGPQESPRPR